ncbi:MAG TPA: 16S rRNA (uracil(1498)-N(3))-methyltransferase [Rhodanobacteraceae bacterium]|nr:16S rRNA (uracil(1498)-N(3))-methyltransferase [Rhodanobacteraceae bacterium]
MREIRLHVDEPLRVGADVTLDARAAAHATRVLRLRPGDRVTLFNGDGNDYAARLLDADRAAARASIESAAPVANEPPAPLMLAQCIARGDKMDLIVQKATELGATRIVPLLGTRSEVRLDAARAAKRLEHWRAVAASACEQCGRARLPQVEPLQPLARWCGELDGPGLRLALVPGAPLRLRTLGPQPGGAVFVVGPEGGLAPADLDALHAAGFADLGLGPRVLRTETAGPTMLAAWQAIHGDF